MGAAVITVSPSRRVADLERMARRSIAEHGVCQLAARTPDGRQRAQLTRIARRLADDPSLQVRSADHTDGMTYVTVLPVNAEPGIGWWGEPKGVTDPDGGYFPS